MRVATEAEKAETARRLANLSETFGKKSPQKTVLSGSYFDHYLWEKWRDASPLMREACETFDRFVIVVESGQLEALEQSISRDIFKKERQKQRELERASRPTGQ